MGKPRKKGRWSVEQRLEFIDFRLFWEGRVNRRYLVDHFGVSVPQASSDLTLYQEQARGNALYDKTLKTYVAGPKFTSVFFEPAADSYLAQLRLIESGLLSKDEAWAIRTPAFSITPVLRRRIDATILRGILAAIRAGRRFALPTSRCRTPSRPHGGSRRTHSVSTASVGTRGLGVKRAGFVDFVLARIIEVGESKSSDINPADDIAWQREITLRLRRILI